MPYGQSAYGQQQTTPLNAQADQARNRIAQALMNIQNPPPRMGGPGGGGQPNIGAPAPMQSATPGAALTPPGSNVGQPAPITGIGQQLGATGGPGNVGQMPMGAAMGQMPAGAPGSMVPVPPVPGQPGMQQPGMMPQQMPPY